MPAQTYMQPLQIDIADGAQILNTVTETILFPDYQFAANDPLLHQSAVIRTTVFGDSSFVITTPGTLIFALRWGGVAGTVLATTGAYAPDPTAALANRAWMVQFVTVVRSIGAAGSMYTMGTFSIADVDDATVTTLQGNLNMFVFPNVPAVVSALDTTTAKALSVTAKHSVNTATTQSTGRIRMIEHIG